MSCDVIAIDSVKGPKGGTVWVRWLTCGHMLWSRGKEPSRRAPKSCFGCWLRRNATPPERVLSEDELRGALLGACGEYVTRGQDDKLRTPAVAVVEAWAYR